MATLGTAVAFVLIAMTYLYRANPCLDLDNLSLDCRSGVVK